MGSPFGSRHALAEQYAELLCAEGVEWGLLGPREADRVWERHVYNCAALAAAVPEGATVVDIGSGAGLPGIPLAIARPDLHVTLLEPLLRRTRFLELALDRLGLDNAVVVRGRAEEVRRRFRCDVATARAVAPLDRLVGWALPLVPVGGELLALRGSSAEEEIASTTDAVARAGGSPAVLERMSLEVLDEPVTLVRVRKEREARR